MIIRSRTLRAYLSNKELARELAQNPLYNDEQTPATTFGHLCHMFLLKPQTHDISTIQREKTTPSGRTSTLYTDKDVEIAKIMAEKARDEIVRATNISIDDDYTERNIYKMFGRHKLLAQPDYYRNNILIEYKTISSHPITYRNIIKNMTYDVQIGFYAFVTNAVKAFFVFQEKKPPYHVRIVNIMNLKELINSAYEILEDLALYLDNGDTPTVEDVCA